jgi:hypothetical protein
MKWAFVILNQTMRKITCNQKFNITGKVLTINFNELTDIYWDMILGSCDAKEMTSKTPAGKPGNGLDAPLWFQTGTH